MTKFETVIIFSPEIQTKSLDNLIADFKSLISKNSGNIINHEDWGLRELSYNIKKFNKAFYRFFQIEVDSSHIDNIKKDLNQKDNVLRYLFIKVKSHQELPTKLANEKK